MSPRRRPAPLVLALAASALLVTGCVAAAPPAAEPEAFGSPAPVASTEPETVEPFAPLVIPPVAADELARVVYTRRGPDGVPTSEGSIKAAPLPDQPYALEGTCIPVGPAVEVSYRIMATGEAAGELQSGTFLCDGTGIRNVGVLDTDAPPQVMFTLTDGAAEAYLRLVPDQG